MMPKGMIQEILREVQGESKIQIAAIEYDGMQIEPGQEIRKHLAGSFSVATFEIVGIVSPQARAMYEDGNGWEFMWGLATEEQKQVPGVLLKLRGEERYEIWTPQDVVGMIRTNQLFGDDPVTPLG